MKELAPGDSIHASAEVALTDDLDVEVLRYAAFRSIPLTVEVFIDESSFWLTRAIRAEKGVHAGERESNEHV